MLVGRNGAFAAVLALGVLMPAAAFSQGRDEEEFGGDVPIPKAGEQDDNSSSGGGFFGSIFGEDDDHLELEEPFIDTFEPGAWNIPPAKEAPPGADLARREVFGNDTVPVYSPVYRAYTEKVARRLLEGIGVTGFVPNVEIAATDKFWGNVYPDGTILISVGMLRNIKREEEFAAFLAHELSHVLLKHYGEDWFLQTQDRGLAIYSLVMDIKRQIEVQQGEYDQKDLLGDLKNQLIAEAIVLEMRYSSMHRSSAKRKTRPIFWVWICWSRPITIREVWSVCSKLSKQRKSNRRRMRKSSRNNSVPPRTGRRT